MSDPIGEELMQGLQNDIKKAKEIDIQKKKPKK